MKSKWLPYAIVLLAVLLIFTLDKFRPMPEEEKEAFLAIPVAVITIGDQEITYKSGTFAWVENGTGPVVDQEEPPILFHDLLPVSVKPFSKMKITFPENAGIDNISVYRSQGQGDLDGKPAHGNDFRSYFYF